MASSGVEIGPLTPAESEEFANLALQYIGRDYDDIDESFAKNIIAAHFNGSDPIGYFTLAKRIWVAKRDGEHLGFLVATEKRGGSVKLGPHIVKEPFRSKGIGLRLRAFATDHYRTSGARKLYAHGPISRLDMLRWDVLSGYQIEAQLRAQYRTARDDFVVGRILRSLKPMPPLREQLSHAVPVPKAEHRLMTGAALMGFNTFLMKELSYWYDQIDQDFVEAVLNARERIQEGFRAKGKAIFVSEASGVVVAAAIATFKRGGALKISPLIARAGIPETVIGGLLETVASWARIQKVRKLYTIHPLLDSRVVHAFQLAGYHAEGLIRSPYRDGVDCVAMGMFPQE